MAKKSKRAGFDYRAAKLSLNKYHKFSFKMPRKGKDFSAQQKSSIRRQYNKLREVTKSTETTFIKKKKGISLKSVNGLHTNKGVVIDAKNARIKRDKKTKKYFAVRKYGVYNLDDYLFPREIVINPDKIPAWVLVIEKSYGKNHDGTMLLRHMTFNTDRYESGIIHKYMGSGSGDGLEEHEFGRKRGGVKVGSIIGITIIWRHIRKERVG